MASMVRPIMRSDPQGVFRDAAAGAVLGRMLAAEIANVSATDGEQLRATGPRRLVFAATVCAPDRRPAGGDVLAALRGSCAT
ncbi:hypothetical protein CFP66_36645 [Pseudonocardia sp. MH-G8]|nr:hypothetical protein CFP66_36645 [Pseudonocardia sp. MH-G8]